MILVRRLYTREFIRKMHTVSFEDLVPAGVRGMKSLELEKFIRKVKVPILKVSEEKLSNITQHSKPYFLKLENFKPIQNDEETNKKCIHLSPSKVKSWTDILEEHRRKLSELNVTEKNFEYREIEVNYNNYKYEHIFKAVLPENEDVVSGYSQIGHIVHLNLREHLLEYRPLIGQVLLDKLKTCRTVVNKLNIIDNTYRNFKMEVIAGEEDFLVTVKENRCTFQFDFSKVYWNPRLCKEHERILSLLKPDDVLFDVFCGVGPFSVPAAKRKCRVYANDLNPDSFKWLNHNVKTNKVNLKTFQSYNLDGKDFICTIFKGYLENYCKGTETLEEGSRIHVTMNLPALAVEFLSHFKGLIQNKHLYDKCNIDITVYVYCFAVGDDQKAVKDAAKEMVIKNIGCDIGDEILDIFHVRNVAPKKEMMRVTFKLSKDIIYDVFNESCEPPLKKICVEN